MSPEIDNSQTKISIDIYKLVEENKQPPQKQNWVKYE